MLNFGGSQLSFFFPMLLFGGPQHSFFFSMLLCVGLLLHPSPPATLPAHKIGVFVLLGVWNPRFRAFRAQNRGFCALLGFGTPVFRHFEHKIEVFVRFWGLKPSFSGFSSTKSRFLCSSSGTSGIGKRKSNLPANHRARFQNANA